MPLVILVVFVGEIEIQYCGESGLKPRGDAAPHRHQAKYAVTEKLSQGPHCTRLLREVSSLLLKLNAPPSL